MNLESIQLTAQNLQNIVNTLDQSDTGQTSDLISRRDSLLLALELECRNLLKSQRGESRKRTIETLEVLLFDQLQLGVTLGRGKIRSIANQMTILN